MSKQLTPAQLHLCQTRAHVPGGEQEQRDRDFERTLHREGPYLIKSELDRIRPEPVEDNLLNRICHAVDILFGRGHVYVERRHSR